ncbi:MAG: hypothetical protein AB7O66_12460 [Limisphaerales bacterium]
MRPNVLSLLGVITAAGVLAASAATDGFTIPAFRGQPGATYDGWENFTVSIGNPGNKGDLAGSSLSATLFQTAPGALVLGSGNIYNGTEASRFEIRYAGTEPISDVFLQVRSLGTELNYESVRLFAWTESLGAPRTELDRVAFGPPPPAPGSGFGVSSLWAWDLTGLDATSFAIAFDAAEINLSLDSATLDVNVVPEPSPMVLGALGLALLGLFRRRAR